MSYHIRLPYAKKLIPSIIAALFVFNSISWARPVKEDALRPPATGQGSYEAQEEYLSTLLGLKPGQKRQINKWVSYKLTPGGEIIRRRIEPMALAGSVPPAKPTVLSAIGITLVYWLDKEGRLVRTDPKDYTSPRIGPSQLGVSTPEESAIRLFLKDRAGKQDPLSLEVPPAISAQKKMVLRAITASA